MDFEFHVSNIEDAILAVLDGPLREVGVQTLDTYSGDFDPENLKKALGALTVTFPLILVSYTDGADKQDPVTSPVMKRSLRLRHDCSFAVICVANDPRGDNARRKGAQAGSFKPGVYRMLSKVRETLGGLNLSKRVDSVDIELYGDVLPLGEEVLLTHDPLTPSGVEFIARLPNMTAYAAIFDTYFRYATPDRNTTGTAVNEFVLGVESLNNGAGPTTNVPGVIFE